MDSGEKVGIIPDAKKFMIRNAVFMGFTRVLELSNTPILRQSMQDLWNETGHFKTYRSGNMMKNPVGRLLTNGEILYYSGCLS